MNPCVKCICFGNCKLADTLLNVCPIFKDNFPKEPPTHTQMELNFEQRKQKIFPSPHWSSLDGCDCGGGTG